MLHVVAANHLGNEVTFPCCINADWYCTLLELPELEAGLSNTRLQHCITTTREM